MKIVISARMN